MEQGSGRIGRPRSEQARVAVLQAVDDLLAEVGYAALTMKGIADRAGVGRQTVYRWWSTKAEILLEASIEDAEEELSIDQRGDAAADLAEYLRVLQRFLAASPAGGAYRALVAAAQHDTAVAALMAAHDPVHRSARQVLGPFAADGRLAAPLEQSVFLLVGPLVYWALTTPSNRPPTAKATVRGLLAP